MVLISITLKRTWFESTELYYEFNGFPQILGIELLYMTCGGEWVWGAKCQAHTILAAQNVASVSPPFSGEESSRQSGRIATLSWRDQKLFQRVVIKTLKETSKKEEETEGNEKDEMEETDAEMETTSEMKGAKQEEERSTEQDISFFTKEMEDLDKLLDRNQENGDVC
ncbi:hypothetical protein GIB67_017059 [Kingdonia uniflora]|uniref:Uncharacterized protein n=1 Tax=Kingdonia uniflora TaxID=39325 RepID=A0A7J7NCG2_9MAGN|nr:hypothetical protein GIB67_017059 [Kingdonia uniflora]